MKSVYVLTKSQFIQALCHGAEALKFVEPISELGVVTWEEVSNGIVLTVQNIVLTVQNVDSFLQGSSVPKETETRPLSTKDVQKLQEVLKDVQETNKIQEALKNITPDMVQEALKEVMERVPRITTIRLWTEEQLLQAYAYAQRQKRGRQPGELENVKPDFIIEPAPRQRRTSQGSSVSTETETSEPETLQAPKRRGKSVTIVSQSGVQVIEKDLLPEENPVQDGPARGFFDDEPEDLDDSSFP